MDKPRIINAKSPRRPLGIGHMGRDHHSHYLSPRMPSGFGHHMHHIPVAHHLTHPHIPATQPQPTQPHTISDEMMDTQGGSLL